MRSEKVERDALHGAMLFAIALFFGYFSFRFVRLITSVKEGLN